MNHPQQGAVYGYTEITYVSTGSAAPYIQQQPPPPSPRRQPSRFRILIRAFIAVCTLIGVLAFFIWLIYRPRTMQVAVATATLARFDLNATGTSAPVLSYNLTARLTFSNPNRRVPIYYDQLRAVGMYQAEAFGRTALPLSFQGTRQADTVPAVLVGSSPIGFGGSLNFGDDESRGLFPVDLWVDGLVRYKFGALGTTKPSTLSVKCHLALQLMVALGWVDCSVIDF